MITTRHGTPIGPRHKAAIAVLALEEHLAGELLSHLGDSELRALSIAVEELEVIPGDELATVLEDFERAIAGPVSVSRNGGGAYVRRLATRSLGEEKVRKLFPPSEQATPQPLEQLRHARTHALADLLTEENPQIAAVVLTQLPPRTASKVLAAMDTELAADLMSRIADLEEIPDRAVLEASESLVRALAATGGLESSDHRTDFNGMGFAAAIVNEMDLEDGDALLGRVGEIDQRLATSVREAMLTFEDLGRIDSRSMAPLLRAIQSETLVVALQTAGDSLRNHFLSALSSRAADTIREDLAALQPRRLSDVEAAQREIIEAAMRLAAEGALQLPPRGSGV